MFVNKSSRIELVDALRGFAILSIMLLHNLEHYDFYYFPASFAVWLKSVDAKIWTSLFFLFSGKSYAIFALLFGFTFNIQLNNRLNEGYDFRARFLWRLFLLLIFGLFNSIFYEGDILTLYAVLGLSLIPVCKLSNKAVIIIAIILLLQPFEWGKFIYMVWHPSYNPVHLSDHYFGQISGYMSGSSFCELAKGNFWNGRLAVIFWSWENGRFFQAPALFMLGMLLGRTGLFVSSEKSKKFWFNTLWISILSFCIVFYFKNHITDFIKNGTLSGQIGMILTSWSNIAFMSTLVSLFVVLYRREAFMAAFRRLIPVGRMTLTNYIFQSIVGSILYYGYGFGMYKYTGASLSLLLGITLFTIQLFLCRWWLKNHKQGPLETLWHKATWIKLGK